MRKFVLALVLFGLVSTSIQWKLNVPRVLLPLTEEGAYYKLFSEGGCFDWKSSRPEVSTSKADSYISISHFILTCNFFLSTETRSHDHSPVSKFAKLFMAVSCCIEEDPAPPQHFLSEK